MRIACAALSLTLARALVAQSDSAAQRSDTARLPATIVTVLRTPVEQARAPYAVGVATRDEIQRGKPGLALDEALSTIPGVQVDNRFNYALGERISIRGFGARAQFGVRGIRVLLDGIPMTLADGQTTLNNVDVASVARAEVARGPASAIYGNGSAGVILLRSDPPDAISDRAIGGTVRVTTGDDGLQRYQVSARAPIGSATMVANAARLTYDGYRDWNDARNDHANVRIASTVGSDDISLVGNWVNYDAHNPGGLSATLLAADRNQAFATNKSQRTGEEGRQGQIGVGWVHRFGGITSDFALHTLARHVDNPIPQRIVVIDRHASGLRELLSVAPRLGARSVRVSGGAELLGQDDDRLNFLNVGGNRGADTLDQLERVDNRAAFMQASVDLTSRLLFMAGARYDRVRFEADDRLVSAGNPDDSGDRVMSAMSPSAGLSFAAARGLDLYTNYSESFETPTTTELANQESGAGGFNPTLQPQRTRSGEIGANGRAALGAVRGSYQLALYRARVRDALIPFEVASAPGRQYFRNAGSAKHQGVEASASLALPSSVFLRTAYTYTDARFVHYAVTTGTTTTVYDGLQVPGVARNRGDATLTWQPSRFFVEYETRASSSIAVNDANSERSPSYVIHGARVGLQHVRAGGLQFSPNIGVLNLFDRLYNTSVVVNAFGGRYYEPGPPRSLYAGLDATF
ncbi:MAG TPA: TonB-dependent receptor [Gemmatimonadaceae bacterium]|nr:TonB-dependent receptor [Gemmatimonadaceae bacterium]